LFSGSKISLLYVSAVISAYIDADFFDRIKSEMWYAHAQRHYALIHDGKCMRRIIINISA
jgi:hypothetical protein